MDNRWHKLPIVVDFGTLKRVNKGPHAGLWIHKMPSPHDYVFFNHLELLEYKIRVLTIEGGSWHTIEAGNTQELESIRLSLESDINDYKTNAFTDVKVVGLFHTRTVRKWRWDDLAEVKAYATKCGLLRLLNQRYNAFIGYVPA